MALQLPMNFAHSPDIDMRTTRRTVFRYSAIVACSAIVANACVFPRTAIGPDPSYKLEPAQFCPGDTVRANFDFIGSDVCRALGALTCDDMPGDQHVTISSSPESFASMRFDQYLGQVDFAPSADRVEVRFDISESPVTFPSVDDDGTAILRSRAVSDQTLVASRFTGTEESTLVHMGTCAGGAPGYADASLEPSPTSSPNLRLRRLCNNNSVIVDVTLSGGAAGTSYSTMLAPGQCLDTGMPGVPTGTETSRRVGLRAFTPDPATRCNVPTEMVTPRDLTLVAHKTC
jgi:hypothetical protein